MTADFFLAPRFPLGTAVRYRPTDAVMRTQTYDLASLDDGGGISGVVFGYTPTRVRVRLNVRIAGRKTTKDVSVDPSFLETL